MAAAGACTSWDLLQPLPSVGFGGKVRSVPPEVVPEDGVLEIPAARAFLTRVNGEVVALSEKCTHLGCGVGDVAVAPFQERSIQSAASSSKNMKNNANGGGSSTSRPATKNKSSTPALDKLKSRKMENKAAGGGAGAPSQEKPRKKKSATKKKAN